MNMIKWLTFVTLVLLGLMLYYPQPKHNISTSPGWMWVSAQCTMDARGVTFCRDSKSGRSWTINPSPVGTSIRGDV